MVRRYTPKQGDVIFLSFNPVAGHEQAGKRPALVVSATDYNMRSGMMLAVPITSRGKGYPFEVPMLGKKISGVVLADQLRALDWYARRPRFIERCPKEVFERTRLLIGVLLR